MRPKFSSRPRGSYTIRKSVDDVAVFFSVSSHGRMINDLEVSDIQIRDNDKPPKRVLQFAPQSKLPLRLALLVDTAFRARPVSFENAPLRSSLRKY